MLFWAFKYQSQFILFKFALNFFRKVFKCDVAGTTNIGIVGIVYEFAHHATHHWQNIFAAGRAPRLVEMEAIPDKLTKSKQIAEPIQCVHRQLIYLPL